MKITVSIPTRGAGLCLQAVVQTYAGKAADPENTRIVVCADDDDPAWSDERVAAARGWGECVIVSRAPREDALGEKWNRGIRVAPADVYVAGADDTCVLTDGWDDKVREVAALFTDGCGVIYLGEAPNAQLPMTQAVTAGWADGFGGLYCGHFPYWFIDMWLDELAMMTGRIVWADVAAAQVNGRGKTKGLRDLRFWNQFFDKTRPVRESQADAAIEELYKDAPWMARRLRGKGRSAMRAMFEGRSQYIHMTSVEAEAEQSTDAPEDDRYLRIKAAAMTYLDSLYQVQEAA